MLKGSFWQLEKLTNLKKLQGFALGTYCEAYQNHVCMVDDKSFRRSFFVDYCKFSELQILADNSSFKPILLF